MTAYAGNPAAGATHDALGGLARIYDAIEVQAVGVSMPMMRMAVFDAMDEFCTRSCLWRMTIAWSMDVGQQTLDLNPLDDATLIAWVLRVDGIMRYRIAPAAIIVDPGDALLVRVGTALVVCKPAGLNDFALPSLLVDSWSEALRDGALYRLFRQPGKPYSDAKLAEHHGVRFRGQIRLARETARSHGDLPRPGFPYFARGSQRSSGFGMAATSAGAATSTATTTVVASLVSPREFF